MGGRSKWLKPRIKLIGFAHLMYELFSQSGVGAIHKLPLPQIAGKFGRDLVSMWMTDDRI
jgi:hypothetical protein